MVFVSCSVLSFFAQRICLIVYVAFVRVLMIPCLHSVRVRLLPVLLASFSPDSRPLRVYVTLYTVSESLVNVYSDSLADVLP